MFSCTKGSKFSFAMFKTANKHPQNTESKFCNLIFKPWWRLWFNRVLRHCANLGLLLRIIALNFLHCCTREPQAGEAEVCSLLSGTVTWHSRWMYQYYANKRMWTYFEVVSCLQHKRFKLFKGTRIYDWQSTFSCAW